MGLYMEHGLPFKWQEFYSGYNELVYSSDTWNTNLPGTVEAFFAVKGTSGSYQWTEQLHRQFLGRYRISADDVPLVVFDPRDWSAPFSSNPKHRFSASASGGGGSMGEKAKCADTGLAWCKTWACDGAEWCKGGQIPQPCMTCS